MTGDTLATPGSGARAGRLSPAEQALVTALTDESVAPATMRAYLGDWKQWTGWCAARGDDPVPAAPDLVALWIAEQATMVKPDGGHRYAAATIERRVAAVSTVNAAAATDIAAAAAAAPVGLHPLVRTALKGMRRRRRNVRQRKADPLLLEDLRILCAAIAEPAITWSRRVAARRDTAVLTAMLAGAYRRSELAAHRLRDVTYHPHAGLHMYVDSSKTDQEGEGMVKALTFGQNPLTCPACGMLKWIDVVAAWDAHGRPGLIRLLSAPEPDGHVCREPRNLPATDAPLLRGVHHSGGRLLPGGLTDHAINEIIQRWWKKVGLDPERNITGHSPRAGFVTEGFRAGASASDIARQTGHRNLRQVEEYRREHAPEAGNAVTRIAF